MSISHESPSVVLAGGGAASGGAARCAARTPPIERYAFLDGAVTGQEGIGMASSRAPHSAPSCVPGRDFFLYVNKFSFMLDSSAAGSMVALEGKASHVVSRLSAV